MASPFQYQSGPLQSSSATTLAIVSKSTTYTATTADDLVLVSTASAWTLSLYTAVGNNGRVLRVKKTSSDFNALTIDPNSSETVDGAATTTIDTQNEELTLVSDGSNWQILDRLIPSVWVSYTPTFGAGFGTVGTINMFSRRNKDSLEIRGSWVNGTVANSAATVTLGFNGTNGGLSVDSTKVPVVQQVGYGVRSAGTTPSLVVLVTASDTALGLSLTSTAAAPNVKQNGSSVVGTSEAIYINAKIPITGWKG